MDYTYIFAMVVLSRKYNLLSFIFIW